MSTGERPDMCRSGVFWWIRWIRRPVREYPIWPVGSPVRVTPQSGRAWRRHMMSIWLVREILLFSVDAWFGRYRYFRWEWEWLTPLSSGNLLCPGRTRYVRLGFRSGKTKRAGGSRVRRNPEFGKFGPGNYRAGWKIVASTEARCTYLWNEWTCVTIVIDPFALRRRGTCLRMVASNHTQ